MSDSKESKSVKSDSSSSTAIDRERSPRTELVDVKKELDTTRSRLALLTSQQGLSLFTRLIDDVQSLVANKVLLFSIY
jgi:hypothetical protein